MRIRSTKPEFWRSKRIASVPWEARLVLKALESYVDDNGVGEHDVGTICGDCFLHDLANPRETSRTLARVSEAISHLHEAGLLWLYEADGRELLYISFWEDVQRIDKAQAGRNPRPDGTFDYKSSVIRESLATPREPSRSLAPGTGEQGNRGTGGVCTPSPPDRFDEFWSTYPRRTAKADAQKAWTKATRTHDPDDILDGARRFAADPNLPEPQFIPHAATWLNGQRWDDGPLPARDQRPAPKATRRGPTTDDRVQDGLALAARLAGHQPDQLEIGAP